MPSQKIKFWFKNPNYLYLLICLVSLIALGAIGLRYPKVMPLTNICYATVLFLGPFYSSSNKMSFLSHFGIGISILMLFVFEIHSKVLGSLLSSVLSLIFFYVLFHKIIRYILRKERITINSIYATLCGYLIIGYTAASLFVFIHSSVDGAFMSIGRDFVFYDFIYFSFITLTSVGYGDIYPLDPLAKMVAMLLAIIGQLFNAVFLAIIVSKYMVDRHS